MNTDVFIKRPVLAIVMNLALMFLGFLSFNKLEVRLYPNIDPSIITVTTTYVGASAQDIETFITNPIEDVLAGIDGLDYFESSSIQGSSSITLHFKSDYKLNDAMASVFSKVSSAKSLLPKDAENSVIKEVDPAAKPVLWVSLISDILSRNQLTEYFVNTLQPQLQNLPGLSEAKAFGRRDYAVRIKLDPVSIWAHNLSVNEVIDKVKVNNTYPPLGKIENLFTEYSVSLKHQLFSADRFNKIVLSNQDGHLITLGDVANAEMSSKDISKSSFFLNKESLFVGLYGLAGANPIDLAKVIHQKLNEFKTKLVNGVKINVLWDSSKFISESIDEVVITIFEATLFVVLVTLLFLGSVRAVIIPALAIPLSLIGVMVFQFWLGYSLNTFTLLAMVLAIGMVVDDAIVVLENIHRHMEAGLSAIEAALVGAREIKFAVIAMTMTLAAVFTPVGFIGGSTGRLYAEFAFTLACAVIVSGFVALTLSPVACAYILKLEDGKFANFIELKCKKLAMYYNGLLAKVMHCKKAVVCLIIAMIISSGFLFFNIAGTLVPEEDSGAILTFVSGPESSNLKYTEEQTKQVLNIFSELDDAAFYGLVNGISGANTAMGILTLKPWDKRHSLKSIIMKNLLPKMMQIPGVKAFPVNAFSVPGAASKTPLNFVIKTEGSFEEIYHKMDAMISYLQIKAPFLLNPKSSLNLNKKSFNVVIDRDAAEDLSVSTDKIGKALFYALGEGAVGKFVFNNRSYDVLSELQDEYRLNKANLDLVTVRSANGNLIPLSALINIDEDIEARVLPHFQGMRSVSLSAIPVPGFPLGVALNIVKDAAHKYFPSNQFSYDFSGQSRDFIAAQGHIAPLFICALIFIFFVLSAQYESFIDPLIILITVPLSTVGSLVALKLIGGSLNLYTYIGILTLIGLISKHGILIVDFANQIQLEKKCGPLLAVTQAATTRLRPILATTAAMILGAMPLALASGPGAAARNEIGWVIVGGMFFGTLLSLFVVPMIYTMLSRRG